MSKRDATPSWSGYIFQGEVAICMALETINRVGITNLVVDNALLIESDEDFSIRLADLQVYQVKAKASSNMSAYKETVEELINRYTYSINETQDPNDRRRWIKSIGIERNPNPIVSHLVSWYEVTDWDPNSFHDRYSNEIGTNFTLIDGEYTLGNIENNTKAEIETILRHFGLDPTTMDLGLIYNYLCSKVDALIKECHLNKGTKKEIPLLELVEDIQNAPQAYTPEVGWFLVRKNFLHAMMDELHSFNGHEEEEMIRSKSKIERAIESLKKMGDKEFKGLLENNLLPHKNLSRNLTLDEFGNYLDSTLVRGILCNAITSINDDPNYTSLAYKCSTSQDIYQTTLINRNIPDDPRYKSQLIEECEKLARKPISEDVAYFINQSLSLKIEDSKDILNNIFSDLILDDDDGNRVDDNRLFGLKRVDEASNDLNQ